MIPAEPTPTGEERSAVTTRSSWGKDQARSRGTLADILVAMQRDIRRIKVALREAAIQAELLGA